jgi:hypothetical protein
MTRSASQNVAHKIVSRSSNSHKILVVMPYLSEAPLIFWQRWYTGWISLRSQLTESIRLMGRRVITLYDALLAGQDMELTPRLTLQRRPGYIAYTGSGGNPFSEVINMYSWKTATQGVYQIFDTSTDIEYIPPGATSPTVIFIKPAGTFLNKTYFFGVGNYLFFSGIGFSGKWDGPTGKQGVTNWGISITNATNTYGPQTAGHGASVVGQGSSPVWSSPSSVTGTSSFASITVTPANLHTSESLAATQFAFSGLSIPSTSVISGIQVTFNGYSSNGGTLGVGILEAGNFIGLGKPVITSTSSTPVTLGGQSDVWNAPNFTVNDVIQTNFGVVFYPINVVGSGTTYYVNDVTITVFTTTGPAILVLGGGGVNLTAINGWSYVYSYGNSVSGEISNASPVSNNTGPFTNTQGVQISLIASSDPQVNQIHVYRTTDSGGGSIFYELPNSPFPNTTGNVTDTALDTALNINSQAATNFQNTPPPVSLVTLEWFAGRLWGAVGNLLYFSTGPDSLSGLQQSNWNPVYVFAIPTSVTRLTSLPNGLLIHDLDEILVVRGTSTTSFTVNSFIRDIGTWNYNAVDTDGSNVYIFTADRQFLVLTASGMEEVGGGVIADQLQNVDPTQAYVTIYRSGLDAMVFLFDIANQVLYPFNTRQNAWCLPALLKMPNITGAGAMEIKPGVWKYLICSNGANGLVPQLSQRDLGTFTDLGTAYAPNVVVGTIQEADPGTLAKMENLYLELTNAGSVPTVSILPNDAGVTLTNPPGSQITGKFLTLISPVPDPPTYGADPVNYRSLRYNWQSIATQIYNPSSAAAVKYVQILIQFAAESAQNEVLGLGLSGKQESGDPVATAPVLMGH